MKRVSKYTVIALLLAVPVFIYSYLDSYFTPWGWKAALSLLILAPLSEEFIFRGVLQDALMRVTRPVWAIVAVSALFALMHYFIGADSRRVLVFFPSLILGWHYYKKRSLCLVTLIHAYYNINYFL